MKKIKVELMNTNSLRAKGMMGRKSLGEDAGMLFKFPESHNLCFWMKNTYVPLDIAFIKDDGTILQISELYPLSTRTVRSDIPCKMALETNQGWFLKNDIGVGDKIGGLDAGNRPSFKKIKQRKIAQMTPMPEEEDWMADSYQEGSDQAYDEQQEVTEYPVVEAILDDKSKIKYAEKHNLAMQIIYVSEESGHQLPPRKLIPIEGRGYPDSKNIDGFDAYDSSPTIVEFDIEGNTIKNFLFSNIISLEVLEEFASKEEEEEKGFSF